MTLATTLLDTACTLEQTTSSKDLVMLVNGALSSMRRHNIVSPRLSRLVAQVAVSSITCEQALQVAVKEITVQAIANL